MPGGGPRLPAKPRRGRKLKQAGSAKKKFAFIPCVKDATKKANKAKLRKVSRRGGSC